jgi:methionyl-tRNA synthetase
VQKFYITTPIYYVNDKPHIGHAYTTVAADVLARWHRIRGDEVFFLTGTDEHGEKISEAARKNSTTPKEFVDSVVKKYIDTWEILQISNDDFIRTSQERHEEAVAEFIRRMDNSGDIYKGEYEGWYCTPDETFVTETQLKDGKCPFCGREVKRIKEESYFFRLSGYGDKLLDLYKSNPSFLSPEFRSEEILNRLNSGLKDLSITRTAVSWGIPFPLDKKHTIYVWVEALINYISALGLGTEKFSEFWPADIHLVGKEINWFHSVIWPAMLMSAGFDIPDMVFAHGWWTIEGTKMSKSLGNTIDPVEMSRKYSSDAFRYFLLREMPLGQDGDFSERAMKARINSELASEMGNLLHRTISIAEKYEGRISGQPELEKALNVKEIDRKVCALDTFGALEEIWRFVKDANRYVNQKEPWHLEGEELGKVLCNLLEACRIISILIYPFMPSTSMKMAEQLSCTEKPELKNCSFRSEAPKPKKGSLLFKKYD